jgi:hypothetical protein
VKTIIAGTRTLTNYEIVCKAMSEFGEDVTEVVSGCADKLGEMWAQMRKIPIKRFPAEWNLYGKSAGMIRNRQMASYGEARERGLLVHVHYIQDEPKKENNVLDSFFK